MANINIGNLANEIVKQLATYTEEVRDKVAHATDEVTKDGVDLLKSNSPKNTGKYAKGWTRKKGPNGYILHNRVYQLTHLLEYGHAKAGGGRVAARVHIRPVEEKVIADFEEKVRQAIQS